MIHRFIFVKRKPGMELDAFFHYWKDVHAVQYGQKIQQARRYLIDTRVPDVAEEKEPVFDGAAEVWMDDIGAAMEFIQSREYIEGSRRDEPNFLAFWLMTAVDVDDHDIIPGEYQANPTGVKLIVTIKRRTGMTLPEFRRHVVEVAAPRIAKLPGIRRYSVGTVTDMFYGLGEAPWDAVATLWFDDLETYRAALASPLTMEHVVEPMAEYADPRYTQTILTQESWVIGPALR